MYDDVEEHYRVGSAISGEGTSGGKRGRPFNFIVKLKEAEKTPQRGYPPSWTFSSAFNFQIKLKAGPPYSVQYPPHYSHSYTLQHKMSSIQMSIEERVAALEQSVAEMKQSAAAPVKVVKQSKKAKKAEAAEGGSDEAKPAKEPTAWNILVSGTVAEMKQSGWASWKDLKGVVWPGSRVGPVKDKKGAETGAEQFVYDGGEHDGKPPSPALGGMVRASYLKAQGDPVHRAKAEAYHAKLAEKRSNASTGSGAKEEPVADAPEAGKKAGGRPKMTEEQKAAAKLKRDAKKAAETAALVSEEVEMAAEEEALFEEAEEAEEAKEEEGAQTPTLAAPVMASVGGGGSAAASAAVPAPKPAAAPAKAEKKFPTGLPKLAGSSMERIKADMAKKEAAAAAAKAKKLDLSMIAWTHKGVEYLTNDRKDVLLAETGEWVGRFDGKDIKPVPGVSAEGPADLDGVGMREE